MGELVNLLAGAVLPGAPTTANGPPVTTDNAGASPSAGSFQVVIAGLMNAIPGVDETVESWAGQQVTENAKPGEKESGKTPDQPTADLVNLLRSSLQTPQVDVSAQAAIVTPAASPSDAPVEQAPVQAGAAQADTETIAVPIPADAPVPTKPMVAAAGVAAFLDEPGSVSPAAVPALSESASDEVREATALPRIEAEATVGAKLPTTTAPVAVSPESPVETPSAPREGIVPRAEAPKLAESQPEKPNADRPLGLDPATTQSAPGDSSDGVDRSVKPAEAVGRGAASPSEIPAMMTQSSEPTAQSPVTVKPSTSVEQMIRDLLPTLEKTSGVGQTSQDAQLDTAKREQGDTSAALAEPRPSFERSLAGAAKSNGYQAPERVVEQKVMEQVVRAAKVHLVDGGASMNLRLDPPHLGTVQMTVSAQQGVVTAHLQTSTETAKQVLEADLALLRQALSDAGIAVDSINVSISSGGEYNRLLHGDSQGGRSGHGARANGGFFGRYAADDAETKHVHDRITTVGGLDYLA